MWKNIRGLGLGLLLIALCAAVLLGSDWKRRVKRASRLPAVSIFQFSSRDLLNESVQGCLDRLAERGFRDRLEIVVRRFDAGADMATASSIAAAIADSDSSMVITFSTPALQAMAAANRNRHMIHLFGTVTDPYQSGVGLAREHPEQRPPFLAGIGTFQPVKEIWRMAKQVKPDLAVVGEIWCTSETCSEACTVLAREVAEELGIRLVEVPVSTSSEITDAALALLERGVEAIWIGGDNIVELAAPTVIEMALQRGIPVFANAPVHAENGALLGLGADYYQVGATVGGLAADVLKGREPGSIPIDNVVPPLLYINTNIISRLKDKWVVPDHLMASAAHVFGPPLPVKKPEKTEDALQKAEYRVGVFYYGPDPMVDRGLEGLRAGLAEQGFIEGRDLSFKIRNAQSDLSQIPQIAREMEESGLDVIVPLTTPCLTAALALRGATPIVFTLVYDPIAAGAGADFTNHLPGVTGIGSFPPLAETMDFIQKLLPAAKKIGTIYNPAEANSSRAVSVGRGILESRGIVLETAAVAVSSDLRTAATALAERGIDAIWITGDNTVISGFAAVAGVAKNSGLVLISNDNDMMEQGATAAIGFNPFDSGFAAAEPIAKVLKGASPAGIPIKSVSVRLAALDVSRARILRASLGDEVLSAFEILTGKPSKRWRIALIEQVDAPAIAETRRGLMDGLRESGMTEGSDYEWRVFNAQGEISMLGGLVDAALAWDAGMVATITTPALQTAMRKVKDRPVIFALSLDPLLIGGKGTHERHEPNVAGVYDKSPFDGMIALIKECMPGARRIGTIFAPSEINSTVFRDYLEASAREVGLELVAVPAQTPTEVDTAALALMQREIDAVCQINDNQNEAGFPAIAEAARKAGLPIFAFSSGLAKLGASVVLANDHYEGGREAAGLISRIMRGQSPASLPFRPMSRTKLIVNLDAAREARLELPGAVIARADSVLDSERVTNAAPAVEAKRGAGPALAAGLVPMRRVRMVNFVDGSYVEGIMRGIQEGLDGRGWRRDVDYELAVGNAQGDVAALAGLMSAVGDEKPDALLLTSTPALQAAIHRVPADVPVVFGAVGAPLAAGAGKSCTEHLPNVTGISTVSDFAGMVKVVKKCFPGARAVGTLFAPAEVNSVYYKDCFEEELNKEGLTLVTRPVTTSSDVANAATALAGSDIDAICQITDNLNDAAFAAIAQAAMRFRKPLFSFVSGQVVHEGAAIAVARDFEQVGKDMIDLLALVFEGRSLEHIPFRPVSKTVLIANPRNAELYRLRIPDEILKAAVIAP